MANRSVVKIKEYNTRRNLCYNHKKTATTQRVITVFRT